ncbi:MAG: class I SAM-dependent methyltransferase, partial [Azoarcus sp.]|nr:class I SAM-dependent methyltransferase [Azoarcus sp.]
MHSSAMLYGRKFFETYCLPAQTEKLTVVEIGSQNVNGSLRDVCPRGVRYIGLDFVEGKDVDIVLNDPYRLPLDDGAADVVVSSSCFEHSEFFWLLFLEAMRILVPGGLFYLNVPSNTNIFHRYPVDCWRFNPDASCALASWGKRNGHDVVLLESFIGKLSIEIAPCLGWHDFVAIFLKGSDQLERHTSRMHDSLEGVFNIHRHGSDDVINPLTFGGDAILIEYLARSL